jgi:hypothetical protein
MKIVGFLVLAWTLSLPGLATAQLKFDRATVDLGAVLEGDLAQHVFTLTNVGKQPVEIQTATPGCNCMSVDFLHEPLAPGAQTQLSVAYRAPRLLDEPAGRFSKSVVVKHSGPNSPVILTVEGVVRPKPEALSQTIYNDTVGPLAFESRLLNVGDVTNLDSLTFTFRVKNISQQATNILSGSSKPLLQLVPAKSTLAPGEESVIYVRFIGRKAAESGYKKTSNLTEAVSFGLSSHPDITVVLTLTGIFDRKYSEAELANSPRISFKNREYDAGQVIAGTQVLYQYEFTNTGKADLIIESTKASCGCTAIEPTKTVIPAGESSYIGIKFDSTNRQGPQTKSITVTSNDPIDGVLLLQLKCNVVSDPFSAPGY